MKKTEYENAVSEQITAMRKRRLNFLQGLPLFNNWSHDKIQNFNFLLDEQICTYGEVIYDIGSDVDKIFILKSGKASVETFIEVEQTNRYPIVRYITKW